jgi:hypothetical protein
MSLRGRRSAKGKGPRSSSALRKTALHPLGTIALIAGWRAPVEVLNSTHMAWRIEESLIRGELDNRTRGRVTGQLWFVGRDEPVVLDLIGNAWRDIAGHLLRFTNPNPKAGDLGSFSALQQGVTGDITASRKVKVPDCSMDELMVYFEARKPFPWHWGNSLYLEWHSQTNGRVVIESAGYQMELDSEATWSMDETAEQSQRQANGQALTGFLQTLAETAAADEHGDEDAPTSQSEARADANAARMDRLLDRVMARMEREGLAPNELARVMAEERKRLRHERGEPEPKPLTPDEKAIQHQWIDKLNIAAQEVISEAAADEAQRSENGEPAWTGTDWHPLVERCYALAHRLMDEPEQHGWLSEADGDEHPLRELVDGVLNAGGKLAGALGATEDAAAWPPPSHLAGAVLVRLKKARGHLRDALAGLEAAEAQNLAEAGWRGEIGVELTAILAEVERFIGEVRTTLEGDENAAAE